MLNLNVPPAVAAAEGTDHTDGPAIFRDHAEDYLTAGWTPVPLPHKKKSPPPEGSTGAKNPMPTPEQVRTWSADPREAMSNLGMRLPLDVVGVDVDNHPTGGDGRLDLAELEQRLGALPLTAMSSSRADGTGIRLFRTPAPLMTGKDLTENIQIIRYGHRYMVVAPSIHPEGGIYRWIDHRTGEVLDGPPQRDDLPMLPQAWFDYIVTTGNAAEFGEVASAKTDDPMAILSTFADGEPCRALSTHLPAIDALSTATGYRHDTLRDLSLKIVRLGEQGHVGAREVLQRLIDAFAVACSDDPERSPESIDAEVLALLVGAVERVKLSPTSAQNKGCCGTTVTVTESVPSGFVSSWTNKASEIRRFIDGEQSEPEQPTVFEREDGRCLLYAGKTHSLYGESESGKSWVALMAAAQVLANGGTVAMLDFEDNVFSVLRRLHFLGVDPAALADGFTYVNPESPWDRNELDRAAFEAILEAGHTLAIVDGVTDAFGVWGLSINETTDVSVFDHALLRPLAQSGAAVVQIDHVTKAKDTRGRFGIGSQHKLAAVSGAAFNIEPIRMFVPNALGSVSMRVTKDRPGGVRQHSGIIGKNRMQESAVPQLDSRGDVAITRIIAPANYDAANDVQVDRQIEKVASAISILLREQVTGISRSGIETYLTDEQYGGYKRGDVREAIDFLTTHGFIANNNKRGHAARLILVEPFSAGGIFGFEDGDA